MAQYLCTTHSCFTIPGRAFVPKPEVGLHAEDQLFRIKERSQGLCSKPIGGERGGGVLFCSGCHFNKPDSHLLFNIWQII